MTIRTVKDTRLPRWPAWAVALTAAWAILVVAAAHLLGQAAGVPTTLCMFRRLTGLPCPTCGLTRAALSLLHGHCAAAWTLNPLMTTLAAALAAYLLSRAVLGRRIELRLSRGERRLAWAASAVMLLANWAYVILWVR